MESQQIIREFSDPPELENINAKDNTCYNNISITNPIIGFIKNNSETFSNNTSNTQGMLRIKTEPEPMDTNEVTVKHEPEILNHIEAVYVKEENLSFSTTEENHEFKMDITMHNLDTIKTEDNSEIDSKEPYYPVDEYKDLNLCHIDLGNEQYKKEDEKCGVLGKKDDCSFGTNVANSIHENQQNTRKIEIEKRFCCSKCNYKTHRKDILKSHHRIHNRENLEWLHCKMCKFQTIYKKSLNAHQRRHIMTNSSTFWCKWCSKRFKKKNNLRLHMLANHKNETNVSEIIEDELKSHLLTHEEIGTDLSPKLRCKHCDYTTDTANNLKRHLKTHKNIEQYFCTICSKTFNRKSGLDSHLLNNHKDEIDVSEMITSKVHHCSRCSYQTVKISNFKEHLLTHKQIITELPKMHCKHCDYTTYRVNKLRRHSLTHSNPKAFICSLCNKKFNRKVNLDSHLLSNHKNETGVSEMITSKVHHCSKCSYQTVKISNFKEHLLTHKQISTELPKLRCKYCDYTTYRINNLNRHLLIHSDAKPFVCTVCSKKFNRKVNLDSHLLNNHRNEVNVSEIITSKVYQCLQCNYQTVKPYELKSHSLTHEEICKELPPPKLTCKDCDYTTDVISDLKRHLITHKELLCTICSKMFTRKISLDSHLLKYHKNEINVSEIITSKVHHCSKCSYQTVKVSNFKAHLLTHKEIRTELPKLYCKHCDYTTYRLNNLKMHTLTHSNIKPFDCTVCNKKFNRKVNLDSHLLINHRKEINVSEIISSKVHQCSKCSYQTVRPYELKSHLLTHEGIDTELQSKLTCKDCDYTTDIVNDFKSHLIIHKKLLCTICSKMFTRKSSLDSHLLNYHKHEIDVSEIITSKVHHCSKCSYQTVKLCNLKTHLLTHKEISTEFPKLHCKHCDYTTDIVQNLKKHLIKHKHLFCTICNKMFTRKSSLDSHLLHYHKNEINVSEMITSKVHHCAKCSFETVQIYKFKEHLLTHKDINIELPKLDCKHCNYTTDKVSNLIDHLKIHSDIEVTE